MNPENFWWLIWSPEHNAWWRRDGKGYTKLRAEAGRFNFADALLEVMVAGNQSDLPEDTLIPEDRRQKGGAS